MKYVFEIIAGTEEVVQEELNEVVGLEGKLLDKTHISIETDNISTSDLRSIMTALRVEVEGKKRLNLFRREWKVASSPAGTNPALAYLMCKLANLEEKDVVYDPFCGSGTIVISAIKYFKIKKAIGSDISSIAIKNSIQNSLAAKIDKKKIIFFESNIKNINFKGKSINKIITNMPFGIRESTHEKNIRSYENFEKICSKNLKNSGLIVALTLEKKLFKQVMSNNFSIIKTFDIDQNGLYSSIFLLKRKIS